MFNRTKCMLETYTFPHYCSIFAKIIDHCSCCMYFKMVQAHSISRILATFPRVDNSCEIIPSHMVFMIFNLEQCIYRDKRTLKCKVCEKIPPRQATRVGFEDLW